MKQIETADMVANTSGSMAIQAHRRRSTASQMLSTAVSLATGSTLARLKIPTIEEPAGPCSPEEMSERHKTHGKRAAKEKKTEETKADSPPVALFTSSPLHPPIRQTQRRLHPLDQNKEAQRKRRSRMIYATPTSRQADQPILGGPNSSRGSSLC
jgi:hypothetical protein